MSFPKHNPTMDGPECAIRQTPLRAVISQQPELGVWSSLQLHWPEYLMEAGLLGSFKVSACLFTALFYFPQSPVSQAIPMGLLRRLLIGLAMALTALSIFYSPWGMQSGAHINPSVTLTFLRLGKIRRWDALFYILAQFTGSILGVLLAAQVLRSAISHPSVRYAVTIPGPRGSWPAFLAELLIACGMKLAVLYFSSHPRLSRFTPIVASILVATYITFEAPLSGMSMNPARSFGSALNAGVWDHFWIYLAAPLVGMLSASQLYTWWMGREALKCCKLHHHNLKRCIFCGANGGFAKVMTDNRYDLIIIGTGAGGGTLAYHLAPSGKRILILERGDYVPREKANWDPHTVNVDGHYNTRESWLDKDGKDLHPHTNYFVGGNTKFYGAALFRLRKEDFGELRHHGGISPAWPISYDDLEPYYTQAESLYQVHGNRGEDPTEPPSGSPYPWPAVSHEPRIQQLSDDFQPAGLKPFHVPVGVSLDEKNPRTSPCIRCNTCDGFPCLVGAKADSQVLCIDEVIKHPNVTLMTNSLVKRLETDASSRAVESVVVERNGSEQKFSADIVVVSAGAINSAALLLRSANDKHPHGLANGSDVVGRHYMGHTNSVMIAISKCPNPTVFQKTLGVNEFYFGSNGFEYPMGHISFVGKLDAITLKAGAPPIAPNFTLELMAKHSLDFWLTSEDLPDPDNRVTIGRDGKIVLAYTPNNLKAHEMLQHERKQAMMHTNCEVHGHECHQGLFGRNLFVGQRIPLAGVAHQNGTLRFGHDPKDSVLDVNCKAHEVDNLYVVDGSFFPSSSAVNPALTIMANPLGVGDHLLARMGASLPVQG